MDYIEFLKKKIELAVDSGFEVDKARINQALKPHQADAVQMHVCPLQLDIVERIIDRFSNPGETVLDPFGGLMTVPMTAVKMNRKGYGIELSPDYFRDGVGYLQEAENERETPTLFDFIEGGEHGSNS